MQGLCQFSFLIDKPCLLMELKIALNSQIDSQYELEKEVLENPAVGSGSMHYGSQ